MNDSESNEVVEIKKFSSKHYMEEPKCSMFWTHDCERPYCDFPWNIRHSMDMEVFVRGKLFDDVFNIKKEERVNIEIRFRERKPIFETKEKCLEFLKQNYFFEDDLICAVIASFLNPLISKKFICLQQESE
jgi:hypothetical protein